MPDVMFVFAVSTLRLLLKLQILLVYQKSHVGQQQTVEIHVPRDDL